MAQVSMSRQRLRESGHFSTPTTPGTPSDGGRLGETSVWDAEKDTNVLFCQHSVEEIRQISQKTRLDIERKKEDLRQMVGERYRDLIEAADSIVDMKTCSGHVSDSVSNLQQLCQRLQQTHLVRGTGGMRGPPTRSESYGLAAQMKLLSDTPENIWGCLERQAYLQATHHYLLAKHIYQGLVAEQRGRVHSTGPASLPRLWSCVANFKETILHCCRQHLQSSDAAEGAMVESLSAIVLLEGCSLRQVFTQFLVARKAAIQTVFHPLRQGHRSVKAQVCEVVGVIRRSLVHIAAIFCHSEGVASSLLLKMLNEFTAPRQKDWLKPLVPQHFLSRLPQSVADFTPTLRISLAEVPPSDIHSSCEEWLATCCQDVERGVGQLLKLITSVKALANIREAMHQQLTQPGDAATEEEGEDGGRWEGHWYKVCFYVVGRDFSIWDTFLQPLVFDRAKFILDRLFTEAESHGGSTLDQLLHGMASSPTLYAPDCHVSSHLWREDAAGSHPRGEGGVNILQLKAKACTPSVFSFCQSFGEKLDAIVCDASHYLPPTQPPSKHPLTANQSHSVTFPFRIHGDADAMRDYLQQSTVQCISRFLSIVNSRVEELERDLKTAQNQPSDSATVIDSLLLIARICQSLSDCCPKLSQLARGCRLPPSSLPTPANLRNVRTRRFLSQSKLKEAELECSNVTNVMLLRQSAGIYRTWADWCADKFRQLFQEQILSEVELASLSSSLVWEDITISEETESGKQVSSVIQVPAQASVYVMSLCFALCQEISRIGGHAVDKSHLVYLSGRVMAGVVASYEELLEEVHRDSVSVPQNCALQLLFNLRFLGNILAVPKESEEEIGARLKAASERLQAFVDPFDLDVFLPHILRNLDRQLQRSMVLLGVLLALRPSRGTKGILKPAIGSAQEKHIVVPLSHPGPRLPSLPITAPPTQLKLNNTQMTPAQHPLSPSFSGTIAFLHHV